MNLEVIALYNHNAAKTGIAVNKRKWRRFQINHTALKKKNKKLNENVHFFFPSHILNI